MNVLVLVHRPLYPPVYGYSRVIVDTYSALAEEGHSVYIISIIPKKRIGRKDLNGVYYVELNEPIPVFVRLATTRILLRISRGELLCYHLSWLSRAYASQNIVESIINIVAEYMKKPDVIIAETIYPGLLAEKLSRKFLTKHIIRIHNIEAGYISSLTRLFKKRSFKIVSSLERKVLRAAYKVYALSYRDSISVRDLYDVNAAYIPPILITKRSHQSRILEKLDLEKHSYYLYVASPHKPNILFLKKVLNCCRNIWRYGYKLVVGGSISPIAERILHKKGRGEAIIAGLLSKEDLTTLIMNAYAFIAPHHGYGVPIKLVEAIQLGVPVITTTNALYTIKGLRHGENVYAVNSIDYLCKAMDILARDNSIYSNIKKGIEEIAKVLNYKRLIKMFIKELSSTL